MRSDNTLPILSDLFFVNCILKFFNFSSGSTTENTIGLNIS